MSLPEQISRMALDSQPDIVEVAAMSCSLVALVWMGTLKICPFVCLTITLIVSIVAIYQVCLRVQVQISIPKWTYFDCIRVVLNQMGGGDFVFQYFSVKASLLSHLPYMDMLLLFCLLLSVQMAYGQYTVSLIQRDSSPLLSYLVQNNSQYRQVFNPTWMPPSLATNNKKGLIARTQDCEYKAEGCVFCGGSAQKASLLTFSELKDGKFSPITADSIVFTPSSFADSWGTEDPRMVHNPADGYYYMTYTAYNGSSILMSLARSRNPTDRNAWDKLGPIFPNYQNSKSGAFLLRQQEPHFLFWGDSDIRVSRSSNLSKWESIGDIFLSPRADHFDSRLVESGPPPLLLSTGDYLFFYNSAEKGWPEDPKTAYHVGWVILDGKQPSRIKQRSQVPLIGPEYSWEKGEAPYACNVPNVVFLQAAQPLGDDTFRVYFGAADASIGSAKVVVRLTK